MADEKKKKRESIFSALSEIRRPPDPEKPKSQVEIDREAARKRGKERRK